MLLLATLRGANIAVEAALVAVSALESQHSSAIMECQQYGVC